MLRTHGVHREATIGLGLLILVISLLLPVAGWGRDAGVEVRRLGLSKVGENTLLTVVLDGVAEPRITPRTVAGKPQLTVDFSPARAGRLPTHLEGDEVLVQQVLTETAGGGVRIILELTPDQPYHYWRQKRPGSGGQTIFILGLKPEATARRKTPEQSPRLAATVPETPSTTVPEPLRERRADTVPPAPGGNDYGYREPQLSVAPGSFAELTRLIPKAAPLFQTLAAAGWTVSESHQYDRPGQRYSRDFLLTNHKYPVLVVKIAYLQAAAPDTPNIGIVSLSTDGLGGETAAKYRELRQWTFAKIKQNFEDIGDFFEDALKPLRVKLRDETKAEAMRDAAVFQDFLKGACPGNPQVAEKVMGYVREKVSPRFEGVQYTVSENPLVTLNLVDFLFVKVYYLDPS